VAQAQRLRPADTNPFDSFDDLEMLLFRQEGVIGRQQATRLLSPAAVQHRLVTGAWRVAHRSVYVVGSVQELTPAQRQWVAVLSTAGKRGAALGGVSALQVDGLRGFAPAPVHVLISGSARDRDPPGYVVVHRSTSVRHVDLHPNRCPPHTSVGRSIVDAAQWAATDTLAAGIVAASFRQGLATLDEVTAAVDRQRRAKRRTLVLDVARDASDGAHSLPEVEFLRLCRRARFPMPKCQATRIDAAGRRRYLDAYFEEYGVHIEIDGEQHLEATARWADMRRQNDLWIAGDRILRFPAWLVRRDPRAVADQVRAALLAAGWRPRPRR